MKRVALDEIGEHKVHGITHEQGCMELNCSNSCYSRTVGSAGKLFFVDESVAMFLNVSHGIRLFGDGCCKGKRTIQKEILILLHLSGQQSTTSQPTNTGP